MQINIVLLCDAEFFDKKIKYVYINVPFIKNFGLNNKTFIHDRYFNYYTIRPRYNFRYFFI